MSIIEEKITHILERIGKGCGIRALQVPVNSGTDKISVEIREFVYAVDCLETVIEVQVEAELVITEFCQCLAPGSRLVSRCPIIVCKFV